MPVYYWDIQCKEFTIIHNKILLVWTIFFRENKSQIQMAKMSGIFCSNAIKKINGIQEVHFVFNFLDFCAKNDMVKHNWIFTCKNFLALIFLWYIVFLLLFSMSGSKLIKYFIIFCTFISPLIINLSQAYQWQSIKTMLMSFSLKVLFSITNLDNVIRLLF